MYYGHITVNPLRAQSAFNLGRGKSCSYTVHVFKLIYQNNRCRDVNLKRVPGYESGLSYWAEYQSLTSRRTCNTRCRRRWWRPFQGWLSLRPPACGSCKNGAQLMTDLFIGWYTRKEDSKWGLSFRNWTLSHHSLTLFKNIIWLNRFPILCI